MAAQISRPKQQEATTLAGAAELRPLRYAKPAARRLETGLDRALIRVPQRGSFDMAFNVLATVARFLTLPQPRGYGPPGFGAAELRDPA
jgi:hypothetical protein